MSREQVSERELKRIKKKFLKNPKISHDRESLLEQNYKLRTKHPVKRAMAFAIGILTASASAWAFTQGNIDLAVGLGVGSVGCLASTFLMHSVPMGKLLAAEEERSTREKGVLTEASIEAVEIAADLSIDAVSEIASSEVAESAGSTVVEIASESAGAVGGLLTGLISSVFEF